MSSIPLYRLLKLKVTLLYTDPEVWREIVVLDSLTLEKLHNIIQVAMGWTNSHLYCFHIGRDRHISPSILPVQGSPMKQKPDFANFSPAPGKRLYTSMTSAIPGSTKSE
jgi:hypothetical protein